MSSRLGRLLAVVSTLVLISAGAVSTAGPGDAAPVPVGFSDDFYFPLTHAVRVVDTRTDGGPLQGGVRREFSLAPTYAAARPGTSPQSAGSFVLNVTVVDPTTAGYLIVGPAGYPQPDYPTLQQSNVNWVAGQTVANQVIDNYASGGRFSVWISSGSADVVVDASGFYPFDSTSGTPTTRSHYLPLTTPTRIYDSRRTGGAFAPGERRVLGLGLPAGAVGAEQVLAASVTVTVVDPTGPGWLAAWDGNGPPPEVSTLNFTAGRTVSNAAVVPVACVASTSDPCSDLSLGLAIAPSAGAQVLVDVWGYHRLDPEANFLGFSGFGPSRIGDSRTATGNPSRLGPGRSAPVTVPSTGSGANGPSYRAVHVTVTAVSPTVPTFLTAYAGATRPDSSFVNPVPRAVTAATAQPRIVSGTFRLYNNTGRVDVVVDVDGYFFVEMQVQDRTALARDGLAFTRNTVRVLSSTRG